MTTPPIIATPTAPPDVTTTTKKTTTKAPPPPPPPVVTTTEKKINCGEGDAMSWDVPKKVYCCLHEGKGCPTTPKPPAPVAPVPVPVPVSTTSPCPIDCNAGYNDLDPLQWVRGWSAEKKLYCCKTANKG